MFLLDPDEMMYNDETPGYFQKGMEYPQSLSIYDHKSSNYASPSGNQVSPYVACHNKLCQSHLEDEMDTFSKTTSFRSSS